MDEKTCSDCGNPYPPTTEYFYATSRGRLECRCKDCSKKKSRKYYADHREERLAKQKAYDEEHAEQKAAWREKNREKMREYHRRYYQRYRRRSKLAT